MAQYLRERLTAFYPEGGLRFPYPTEANGVFVELPRHHKELFEAKAHAYSWGKSLTRFVCSFDSTREQVDRLMDEVSRGASGPMEDQI